MSNTPSPNEINCAQCKKVMPAGSSSGAAGKPWRAENFAVRHESGAQFVFSSYFCDDCYQAFPNGLAREQFVAEQFDPIKRPSKELQAEMDGVRRRFSPCPNCRSKKIKSLWNVSFDGEKQAVLGKLTVSCAHCGDVLSKDQTTASREASSS